MRQIRPNPLLLQLVLTLSLGCILGASAIGQSVVVAHRGGAGLGPENTLPTIQKSLDLGAEAIEIDIHQSLDSVLVLSHDETLNRCTNGQGRIDAHNFEEIRRLDAGSWWGEEFEGTQIPTLEEAMLLVNGRAELWIEIKGNAKEYPGLEKRLVELIRKYNAFDWVQVLSFETAALQRIHEMEPKVRLQKLLVSNLRGLPFYLDTGLHFGSVANIDFVDSYGMMYKFARRRFVRKMMAEGKTVNGWTVNQESKACKLFSGKGLHAITTNHPDKVKKALDAWNKN